ncbi:urea-proton symporter DUR3-like [Pecten maximus]|uniref:urea-proton symporter DUR3-like n=1 Tax=Pecten maximus TaxID=6579 RepID=UPI001458342E|nr:urea-proton symporter DUR3-like [Pecten maximus]
MASPVIICVFGVVLCLLGSAEAATNDSECPIILAAPTGTTGPKAVLEKHESALLMLLGFGGFSIILAMLHNAVRKYIFHDEHNLDTTFDAGGNVSMSLTAVTVASQLFWPGDILHSATLTTKNGIAGPFWYAVGIMINIFIFPIFSVQFKTRAPGAKTYLQVIHARFGKTAHIVFCCFALLTNLVIMIGLLLAGRATIQSLTKYASDEFCLLVMATLFGSYSLIGGIGTTFYVSYFNACLVFTLLIVFVVKILHSESEFENIGDVTKMYKVISCVKGPKENAEYSFLTFRSGVALLYGVIEVFVSSAVTYCDQASWQSRIAAKPVQGVWGFLLAGFMWFSIPSTMATTTGMAYIALSAENGTHLLNAGQLDQGLVTPLIAEKILGSAGGILILTMGAMALMSTGSGEVMAISSIVVYDIYQTYLRPFRKGLKRTHCVLCGRTKKQTITATYANDSERDQLCQCRSVSRCHHCVEDLRRVNRKSTSGIQPPYQCPIHGRYRQYQDYLIEFKNWCIIWVTISIIPLGLIIFETGIDLNWIFYSGAILTIPCFPPVMLSILWVKATSKGLVSGGLAGLVLGVTATLAVASMYEGGLNNFLLNTVQDYTILAGTCCSFGASLICCIVVSIFTNQIKSSSDEDVEWQKLYDIDNPLNPWELNYREELKGLHYDTKPTFEQMSSTFRKAKMTAYIGGTCSIAIVAFIIPGIMASFPMMDEAQFVVWVGFTQAWAVIMALVVIIAPPAEEITRIVKQYRVNQERQKDYTNGCLEEQPMSEITDKTLLDGTTPVAKL